MATLPSLECPVCHQKLDESTDLETHLVDAHSQQELAEYIIAEWEAVQLGDENVMG